MQTSFMHPCSASYSAYLQDWPFLQKWAAQTELSESLGNSWTDIPASTPVSAAYPNPFHCYLLGLSCNQGLRIITENLHQLSHPCWHIAARDCILAPSQGCLVSDARTLHAVHTCNLRKRAASILAKLKVISRRKLYRMLLNPGNQQCGSAWFLGLHNSRE